MASWDGKPALTAATIAGDDRFPVSDQSKAAGSRDATIILEELAKAMGGTQLLSVADTSHGFTVGDVLRFDGTNWVEAKADTAANAVVAGMVVSVPDTDTFALAASGFVSGLTSLTAGSTYYLQDAGGLGTSAGTVSVPVLLALTTTSGVLLSKGQKGDTGSAGSAGTQSLIVACSDETTDLTTGTGKVTFRLPYAFTLSEVRASVSTAPAGSALTVDINESGSSILSTKLTIDAGEKTSESAATPPVISDSALADDAEITIDIDQIGSTAAGKGLKVAIIGTPT